MTDVRTLNYFGYTIRQDMQVDYSTGDPIINSIFKQFDKDLNGNLDNEEWSVLSNYIQNINDRLNDSKSKKINKNVVNYYAKKCKDIDNKFMKLAEKFEKIDNNSFSKLIDFEKAHPEIIRNGYSDESEVPEGAVRVDISSFQMGIYDAESDTFTGECYQKGYIAGLEKLKPEEKKEYLDLLKKAQKETSNFLKYSSEMDALFEEYDKYSAMLDLAESGEIAKVGSVDYEDKLYSQYVQIRSIENPFYKQIKELEEKRNATWLKGTRTEADDRLIEQYDIRIQQLYEASSRWSIKNASAQIWTDSSDFSSHISNNTGKEDDLKANNSTDVEINFSNENFNVRGNTNLSNTVSFGTDHGVQSSLNASVSAEISRGNFSLTSNTSTSFTAQFLNNQSERNSIEVTNLSQSLSLQKGRASFEANGSISEGNKDFRLRTGYNFGSLQVGAAANLSSTESGTYKQYSVDAAKSIGKFSVNSGISTDTHATTYKIGAGCNLGGQINEYTSYNITPQIDNSYNDAAKTFNCSQNLYAGLSYRKNSTAAEVSVSNNLSESFCKNQNTQINNTMTFSGNITHRKWGGRINYTNSCFTGSTTNTIGGGIEYSSGNNAFGLSFSHSNNKFEGKHHYENMINANAKFIF